MPLKKGDFTLINLTTKIKESNETIETTVEQVAKETNIHHSDHTYEPEFIVVGEGWVPKGLDEALANLEADKETTIEVPPDKGYGERDPSKMRLIPMRRFRDQQVQLVPGAQVEIDGRSALVRSVGAGRVQVDFNHPLAGRTLLYTVKLEKTLESNEEKVKALVHRRLPMVSQDKLRISLSQDDCSVELPEEAFFIEGLQIAKRAISTDLQKFMPDLVKVTFIESFQKAKAASEEIPKEAAPSADTSTNP